MCKAIILNIFFPHVVISLPCKVLQDAEFAEMSAKLLFKLVKKYLTWKIKPKTFYIILHLYVRSSHFLQL